MTNPHTVSIAGYRVCSLSREACVADMVSWVEHGDKPKVFACANPHALAVAERQADFKAALSAADWLTPDGIGVVLASRVLGRSIPERVTGMDVFTGLSQALSKRGGFKAFYLGSTETTLSALAANHAREFPNLGIAGTFSPPFVPQFSEQQTNVMIEAVNRARPDVLWVGMTAPKQELWIHRNVHRLDVKFVGAIGAAFDFFAGTVKRPAPVYQQLGLEWLVRLLGEPRRLAHRTFVSAPRFMWLIAKHRNR